MPMLWSAVSYALALAAQGSALSQAEARQIELIQKSIVTIVRSGRSAGSAVLIDGKRLLMAHQNAVGGAPVYARAWDGTQLRLVLLTTDAPTQLVLLRADKPVPGGTKLSVARSIGEKRLFAIVPEKAILAEHAGAGQMGVMNATQRLFTLSEIRFEAPASALAGAPVFNFRGELVGMLGATLEQPGEALADAGAPAPSAAMSMRGGAKFGPGTMTVAYSLTADVLQRVVTGFLSPSLKVQHPVIGVLIRDAQGGGVLVEAVQDNSPAAKAGLKTGDIILAMNNEEIGDKVAYGRFMARQEVGNRIILAIRRGGAQRSLSVRVGA